MPELKTTTQENRPQIDTVLQALLKALAKASAHNQNHQVAPAAILWPDKDQQWGSLAPLLRATLPCFLTLGEYDPATRTGPAIWIKCMIARTLPEARWTDSSIPIVYLPGVSRQDLRAVESCPKLLQPLAELQYRGVFWSQHNSKDWTVFAFLKSKDGLRLDVAQDSNTQEALLGSLLQLAETRIAELQGKRLEAADFYALLTPDPVKDLLQWLDDPQRCQGTWDPNRWNAFSSICRSNYGFDPQKDGVITAGEQLGLRQNSWSTVWNRFAEAPGRYAGIPDLLRKSKPNLGLFSDQSSWPQDNETQEQDLRKALLALKDLPQHQAIQRIHELESQQGQRRHWVWAALGQSPLAQALEHLESLAKVVQTNLGGSTPQAMAELYTTQGWQADAAVIQALAAVEGAEDLSAITAAVRVLYTPWLEASAQHVQALIQAQSYPQPSTTVPIQAGECILFADGLRFDIARLLEAELQGHGWQVESAWGWVSLPSVTATCKPAISPITALLQGTPTGEDFRPEVKATGKPLTPERFVSLMAEQGIQFLSSQGTGDPRGKGWTEFGEIDHYGHEHGKQLAHIIPTQIRALTARIRDLLNAGWVKVHIVTDHGWLLLPGGLPKSVLPKHLTETHWGRCAVLKDTSTTEVPSTYWFWSAEVRIALASGISCFREGTEYAHGGISLQECVTPNLEVSLGMPTSNATIGELRWQRLRCRIRVVDRSAGLVADIRRKPGDPSSSLAGGGKTVSEEGHVSLVVEDDSTEGESAVVVLMDSQGKVIYKRPTIIGGEG